MLSLFLARFRVSNLPVINVHLAVRNINENALIEFLNWHNYYSTKQSGFRKHLSAEDILITFLESNNDPINGNECAALFIYTGIMPLSKSWPSE